MGQLIITENLKMKRTMVKKLLILAPIITLAISFLAGSLFYSCAFNWWYTTFFPVMMAITCVQIQEKEQKKLDYKNIFTSPVSFLKIWFAKSYLAVVYSFFACMLLSVIVVITTLAMGTTMKTGIVSALLAGGVISLSCVYQIPIYLYLSKRFNFLATFISSIVFVAAGIVCAEKSYWLIVPPAWCDRSMYSMLHIMANGLFMEDNKKYLVVANNSIIACICMSVGLFVIGTLLVGFIIKREVGKK